MGREKQTCAKVRGSWFASCVIAAKRLPKEEPQTLLILASLQPLWPRCQGALWTSLPSASGQDNRPLPLALSLSLSPRARVLQREVCLPGHSVLLSPEMRAGGALFVLSQRVLPEHILGVASLRQRGRAVGVRENTGV